MDALDIFNRFATVILALCAAVLIYLVILLVVAAKAENLCLSQGYPSTSITYDFDVYCRGYDGAVYPVVKKQ